MECKTEQNSTLILIDQNENWVVFLGNKLGFFHCLSFHCGSINVWNLHLVLIAPDQRKRLGSLLPLQGLRNSVCMYLGLLPSAVIDVKWGSESLGTSVPTGTLWMSGLYSMSNYFSGWALLMDTCKWAVFTRSSLVVVHRS